MKKSAWIPFIIGIILRLPFINAPMLDAFVNMRQTYTAGFTRYMIQKGVTLSNLISAKSITITHNALEVPVYNLLTVFLARIFGDEHFIYRPTSLIYWILGAFYFHYLCKRVYGRDEASYIIWVYVLLPLSVFIGRYYHPEILSILLSMAVVFHFYFFLEKNKPFDLLISIVALTLALLIRAAHFHLFIVLFILASTKYRARLFLKPWLYAFLLPFAAFILWIKFGSDLSTVSRMYQLLGSPLFRFTPVFLGMMIFNRLGGLILSPVGLPLLVLALASGKNRKSRDFEFAWFYAALAFLFIVARGNFMNFHYQAAVILPTTILIGRFLYQLSSGTLHDSWSDAWIAIPSAIKIIALSIYIFLDILMIYFFYSFPWDYYTISETLSGLNIKIILLIFIISQITLIPTIVFLSRLYSRIRITSSPKLAIVFLILILITGLFPLAPMYRVDTDYLKAAKTVDEVLPDNAKIVFSGKKTDADPLIFYSNRWGYEFNPVDLYYYGFAVKNKFPDVRLEYFVIMNENKHIQQDHPFSGNIMNLLNQLDIVYSDSIITIYSLEKMNKSEN